MALFKRGNKTPETESTTPKRKRKPNQTLASVVNESAPGSVVNLLSRNDNFILPNRSGWLVLLLSTGSPEFGGLSVKHKGDEAKGSIIELITGDHIQVMVTAEMLAEDVLGIIPNEGTLERMDEYTILRNASFVWGVVSETDDGGLHVDAVAEATYHQAVSIAKGKTTVAAELPEVWAWAGGETAEAAADPDEPEPAATEQESAPVDASEDPFGEEDAPVFDEADEVDEADGDVQEPTYADEDEGAVDYAALADEGDEETLDDLWGDDEEPIYDDPETDEDLEIGEDAEEATYHQYMVDNADRVVEETEVRESIVRRFSDEDLGLVVDVEEFDRIFQADAPAVTIDVGEASDWLSNQVGLMATQANAELVGLHEDNMAALREQYVQLMGVHAEKVGAEMSLTREGAYYHELLRAAENDLAAGRASANEETTRLRKEISDRFDAEAEEVAEAAAAEARARFHRQNRQTRERLLSEAGIEADRRSDERFVTNKRSLMDMRKAEAWRQMELGNTLAIQHLAAQREEQREAEAELMRQWTDRISRLIDENRKNDVARTEALAEQLARQNSVTELTAQFAAEREELQAEQQAKIDALTAQMAADKDRALSDLREQDQKWQAKLSDEEERTHHANDLVQALTDQLSKVNESVKAQYGRRLVDLEADKKAFSEELDRANKIQKRANTTMLILLIALVIAGLLVGFIVGWVIAGQQTSITTASAVLPWWEGWPPTV